jgi:hypothetical protein
MGDAVTVGACDVAVTGELAEAFTPTRSAAGRPAQAADSAPTMHAPSGTIRARCGANEANVMGCVGSVLPSRRHRQGRRAETGDVLVSLHSAPEARSREETA